MDNGFVTEEQVCIALARKLNIPYVALKFYNVDADLVRLLPETPARRFRAIALEERNGAFMVGMSDPTDLFAYDEISRVLKREISLALVNEAELLQTTDRIYHRTEEISGLAREAQDIEPSTWYYDLKSAELVYSVRNNEHFRIESGEPNQVERRRQECARRYGGQCFAYAQQ